jgi:hypothetical protein
MYLNYGTVYGKTTWFLYAAFEGDSKQNYYSVSGTIQETDKVYWIIV